MDATTEIFRRRWNRAFPEFDWERATAELAEGDWLLPSADDDHVGEEL